MDKKVYLLNSCSTCQRILKELNIDDSFELQNIKTDNVSETELDAMKAFAGSYEALFSRRAMKFRAQNLHTRELNEDDYRRLILEEYTFLKRPVIQIGNQYFVGNSKKVVTAAKEYISQLG